MESTLAKSGSTFGVTAVAQELRKSLIDYIEASRHIRDESVVRERRLLLEERNVVAQKPFIETTPTYELGDRFDELGLPEPFGGILSMMVEWSERSRIFSRPYAHQATALKEFFLEDQDLIVSTGTGSGKTETFLWPILGNTILESTHRPKSWQKSGIRALMLYPTNALVGDQLARLRRLFGASEMRDLFGNQELRIPTFGMYTSRTPYPGVSSKKRDTERLSKIVDYYREIEGDRAKQTFKTKLEKLGRWPAKNMSLFAESDFNTGPHDSELFSRHEMHNNCPDILVTNYSMLEYMLIRPIDRSIFNQTKQWLQLDQENQLLFILDEAHLYRGSSGVEVALLIRRLIARLGVSPDRIRFILTSASLGSDNESRTFARDLTSKDLEKFSVVTSTLQQQISAGTATVDQANILATIEPELLYNIEKQPERFSTECERIAVQLGWDLYLPQEDELQTYLFATLTKFPPMQLVLEQTTGNAKEIGKLAAYVFPKNTSTVQERALDALLVLGAYARKNDRPLLPARVHLMFRGLSGLYACINRSCSNRRFKDESESQLGALYTTPRIHCECGCRVYELLSHSNCGALFL